MKTLIGARTAFLLAAMTLAVFSGPVRAADVPLKIQWAELVPKGQSAAKPNKTFFAGSTKTDPAAPPPPPLPEGKFMSVKRSQPGVGQAPAVVAELNGKRVEIGGYIVPLDFDATTVKEFLLVPFVGACIHVPPPPANQIVYVKAASGIDINGAFEPVTVVGTLKTEPSFTGLADTGYTMEADNVQIIKN